MSRAPIEPGHRGATSVTQLGSGRWQARVRYRDYSGRIHVLKASADTEAAARAALDARSHGGRRSQQETLTSASSISSLAAWWAQVRRTSGRYAAGTIDNDRYDSAIALELFGLLRISEVDRQAVDRGILHLAQTNPRAARRARAALRSMFNEAIRIGVAATNPVTGSIQPRIEIDAPYTLTPVQALALRDAFRQWWLLRDKPGPKPDPRVADMIDIMLGLGIRIGELLALRTCDVSLDTSPPTLHVGATLVDGPKGEPIWQDHPKAKRQKRDLVLAATTADTLRPYMNYRDPTAPIFPNRHGGWLRPGNVRRILRSFRDEVESVLHRCGIDPDEVTPHLFRRTLATMIANEFGVDRAKEQLGHASVQTTERHYVTPPKVAGSVTVSLVDGLYGTTPTVQPDHDTVEVDRDAFAQIEQSIRGI